MKYYTLFIQALILAVYAICLSTCASTAPSAFPPAVDYTDGRSVIREIAAVRSLIPEKPLEALLRAKRLAVYTENTDEVNSLYKETTAAVSAAFMQAVTDGKWDQALRFFHSMTAVGNPPAQWSEKELTTAQQKAWKEQGFSALLQSDAAQQGADSPGTAPSIETVRHMMKGVVTVWVDRGITIEKGLGRADRMIGSGFFIDGNGYLVTNYHVIQSDVDPEYEGFSRVYIKLPGDTVIRIPAKVIGWDAIFDLALLKTEITPEVYFQLGSSEDLNIGSRIYAIGSPAGLEQTLTSGIVSAQNRRFLSLGSVLQIDAPVNHGSSGGPIIDEAGRVQAIVFAGLERQEGLNFAIPVELLKLILPQLYAGGAVSHGWLSAYGVTAKETPQEKGGAKLVYAIPGSSTADVPAGTLITHINGQPIASLEALQTALMHFGIGTIIKLSGIPPENIEMPAPDASASRDWYVQLDARPEQPAELIYRKDSRVRAMLPFYGITLENAGGKNAFRIADVIPGSYADEAGFSTGDYLEIRRMEVHKTEGVVYTQIYTKRRKSAYLDAFMDIWAYADSPSYL